MDIFGSIPTGASNHDLTAVLVPFQYRSGGNTKPSTYFGGDRYLSLRGEPRSCDRHDRNITMVIDRGSLLVRGVSWNRCPTSWRTLATR